MRFRGTILLNGKTATGLPVPPEVVEGLGAGRRPAVRVTIGDHIYRTSVGTVDGRPMLPISADVRAAAGVAAGDDVTVEIELDTEPREAAVPADLAVALDQDATAKAFFEGLSSSNQRGYVSWVEEAKKAETRATRVAKAVAALRAGRPRH